LNGIDPSAPEVPLLAQTYLLPSLISEAGDKLISESGDYVVATLLGGTEDLLTESGLDILISAATVQGVNPQAMLRWSDDGGHTWSNEHWRSMGAIGQYGYRTIWRRLGMTEKLRDRVYEVSGTDPVKIAIMGAELFITPTNA
jgi:hypothetical protein